MTAIIYLRDGRQVLIIGFYAMEIEDELVCFYFKEQLNIIYRKEEYWKVKVFKKDE